MSRRVDRVAELIKRQLSEIIRSKVSEEYGLVTITDVILTSDLKNADIFISVLEKSSQDEVIKKLTLYIKEFQHLLGKTLEMRYTPKLFFKPDRGLEQVNKV